MNRMSMIAFFGFQAFQIAFDVALAAYLAKNSL